MGKIEDLLVKRGLYDSIDICFDDLEEMEKYLSGNEHIGNTVDCYCPECKKNRIFGFCSLKLQTATGVVFTEVNIHYHSKTKKEDIFNNYTNKRYDLTYQCARDSQHKLLFDLISTDDKIIKIGQFPSVADLAIPEISKYKSVLGSQFSEFSKALGLFAHGIGIGSFVYLRRIIENLVFSKYNDAAEEIEISTVDFNKLRFDEKINALKDYLPKILVDNKNIYGIVSKGIHELSEEECKEMFPGIKAGIELILDDLLATKVRKEKEKEFTKFIAQKTGELKK